jgi:hypothetical protein
MLTNNMVRSLLFRSSLPSPQIKTVNAAEISKLRAKK